MKLIPGRKATPVERRLQSLLLAVAAVVLLGAFALMLKMDQGSRSQGGRFYVAIFALLALGAIDTQIVKVARRRWPVQIGTSDEERRYALMSLFLLLVCGAILVGFAFFFP